MGLSQIGQIAVPVTDVERAIGAAGGNAKRAGAGCLHPCQRSTRIPLAATTLLPCRAATRLQFYLVFWTTALPAVTSGVPATKEATFFLTQSAARRLDSSACAWVSKMLMDAHVSVPASMP